MGLALICTALSVVFTGPLPLLRLRGGEDILLRVRTSTKGQLRVSLPETSTLAELQKLLQKEHKFPLARQKLKGLALFSVVLTCQSLPNA